MSATEQNEVPGRTPVGWFQTTHWSVVLAAQDSASSKAAEALEKLCRAYWPPLYAYLRREGHAPADAQDLTQEFLSRFVHKDWLHHLQDQRGKFRSFLLTFLKHFLSDQRDRAQAQKRGGNYSFVSLDGCQVEEREALEPMSALTADRIYDKRWAEVVMSEAVRRLADEYSRRGSSALFEQIKDLHPGEHGERTYAQIGATLRISEQAVKNAVHSFRRRFGQLVRAEIAQTVSDPEMVSEELQHLMQAFAR